jgi:hypothetical protein
MKNKYPRKRLNKFSLTFDFDGAEFVLEAGKGNKQSFIPLLILYKEFFWSI